MDNSNSFAVVHNGIIENYSELRDFLIKNGYTFLSQTDTEVIPNLIHYYFSKDEKQDDEKFLRAVKSAIDDLKGSYAIEVISPLYPDRIIVVRKDSPLVIGKGEKENHIASDIPALLTYTKDFYLLNDNEYAVIYTDHIRFYDSSLEEHNKPIKNIEWDAGAAEKGGFEDYMLKEIFEQPNSIRETVGSRFKLGEPCFFDDIDISKDYLSTINKIYIVACGTAYNAGLVGKHAVERFLKVPVVTDIASEFRYSDPFVDENTLVILASQSGETADTLSVLREAKAKGATVLSIANVVGSSIARESDYTLYTWAGPEIAVASTKAYTTQIVAFIMIALDFGLKKGTITKEEYMNYIAELKEIPDQVAEVLKCEEQIKEISKQLVDKNDIFYLGRGLDYSTAMEGALKITYTHAEAFAAGELKHGTIALIEEGVPVIVLATQQRLFEKMLSNMQEVKARGANVISITEVTNKEVEKSSDSVIYIPEVDNILAGILSVIPLQLLAYYVAKERGCDIDKPRNLAKSVTVE